MPRINRADREHVTALSLLEVGEGSVVGDYRLERILARGGMGVVYVARQVSLKRRVVLKLIVPELADNESFHKRFERESRAALEIEHPNIVPVFETGAFAGLLFIAMRYIDGSDLRHVIASDAPLDPRRVLGLVEQIASALDAAHHVGLVHRDVKPGNVLVERLSREREHCYVTDFGLVKRSELSEATSTGKWMGTPAYVAPEQLTGAEVDARADVYSLGVLLFDALAGHPPFQSEHSAGVLLAHLHSPPPRITDHREELRVGSTGSRARDGEGSCPALQLGGRASGRAGRGDRRPFRRRATHTDGADPFACAARRYGARTIGDSQQPATAGIELHRASTRDCRGA